MNTQDGLAWLASDPVVRRLPIKAKLRDEIAARYWYMRGMGYCHKDSKVYAVAGIPWFVILALQIILPILWAKLREWWENRDRN